MKKKLLSFALAFLFCFSSIGMLAVAGGHEHIHAATTLTGKTVTDTTVSFDVPDAGYYIKINTGIEKDANSANAGKVTFDGLTANTEYTFTFYQKVSPTDLSIATEKVKTLSKMSSPSTPSASAVSSTTITVNSYTSDQYCIKASADSQTIAESDWKNATGSTYTFANLTAGTEYKIYARTKGTAGISVSSNASEALTVTTVGKLDAVDLTGATLSYDSANDSYTLVLSDQNATHQYKLGSGSYVTASASGVPFTVALGSTYTITGRIAAQDNIYGAGQETSLSVTIPNVTISTSLTGTVAKLTYTVNANALPLSSVEVEFRLFNGVSELTTCNRSATITSIAAGQYSGGTLESDIGSVTGSISYIAKVTGTVNGTGSSVTLYETPSAGATLGSTSHTHTFSSSWSKDSSGHWHAATCEHTSEKSAFAAHTDSNKDGKCDVCGYVITTVCQHPSVTHTLRKEATETQPGNYEYWQCNSCHKYFASPTCASNTEILLADTVIPAKGHTTHTPVLQPKVDATCTTDGHTAYYKCSCGKCFSDADGKNVITEASTKIAAGHDLVHKNVLYATATEDGYQAHWYCRSCQKCFSNEAGTTEFNPKVAKHTHIYLTGSDVCNVSGCGYVRSTHTHNYNQKVETATYLKTSATCTSAAVYYYSCSCGECGSSTFTSSAGPLGHNYVNGVCTRCQAQQGGTGGISHKNFDPDKTACPYCGKINWGEGVFEISPCSAGAKSTGAACTYTCKNCDRTVAVTWEPEECTGTHHYGERLQLPSLAWVQVCEYCGDRKVCEDQSCSHSQLDWVLTTQDADCEVAGSWTYECKVCHSINFVTHKASSHAWDNGVVTTAPTDTTAGVKTYTCLVCQKTRTEGLAPLKHVHSYGSWIAEVPATCSAEGVKGHYTCSCGMNFDESKNEIASLTIAKLSHTYGAVTTVASTCTTPGYEEKTCTVCGYQSHVTLPLASHTEKVTTTPATCIADGSDVVTCAVCGKVLETRTIPATGIHSFGNDGDDAKKCVVCGFRYETTVNKGTVYITFSENGAALTIPSVTADRMAYEAVKKGTADYAAWLNVLSDAKAISDSAELCMAYDVALKNNGSEMPYASDMKVELTIPEEYKKNSVKVFASTANGMVSVESVDRSGDKVSFSAAANYTGEFLIISDSAAKTGNPVVPIVIGIVVVLAIAGVGGYFLYKKGFFTV